MGTPHTDSHPFDVNLSHDSTGDTTDILFVPQPGLTCVWVYLRVTWDGYRKGDKGHSEIMQNVNGGSSGVRTL